MQETLKNIIENKEPKEASADQEEGASSKRLKKWINAFIFVYESGNTSSFRKLLKIIKSVYEFEQSLALGKDDPS